MTVVDNISTIISAAASTDIAQKIERGIQRFTDDLPWLMKALDEVARIHPVVTGTLLTLSSIYSSLICLQSCCPCFQGGVCAREHAAGER